MNLIIPERLRARHWAGWEATMRTAVTRPSSSKERRRPDRVGVAVIRDVTERFIRESTCGRS